MKKITETEIESRLWEYLIKRLETLRKDGLSQAAIADKIGVKQQTIGRWLNRERGEDRLTLATVLKIIVRLGVSMAELAEVIGEKSFATVIDYLSNNLEMVNKMAAILDSESGAARRKLEADIDYLADQLQKR